MNNITKPHTFVISTAANPTEVNANFDTAYTGINNVIDALNDASGSKNSIDERLDVALNEDGTIKAGTVISGNTTSSALKITQEGTGNALLVEDSASTDTSAFVIANDGKVIVSGIGPYGSSLVNSTCSLQVGTPQGIGIHTSADDAIPCSIEMVRKRATGNVVQNNDGLGRVIFGGNDGVGGKAAAYIDGVVDGTPGTNDMPGRIVMSTSPDGSTTPTERLRIDSAGLTKVTGTFETTSNATVGGNLTVTGNVAHNQTAKAWVNFDGTGTPSIRKSFNVTSVTDNGTGLWTINFTNALPDANYAVATSYASSNVTYTFKIHSTSENGAAAVKTTSALQLQCKAGSTYVDNVESNVIIFG